MFSRIDTVVLRVLDLAAAQAWYEATLGLTPVFVDAAEGLAVLGLDGTSITLWQLTPEERASAAVTRAVPILAVADADAAHRHLVERGADVDSVRESPGIRYFGFRDLDGNRLEACQVLA